MSHAQPHSFTVRNLAPASGKGHFAPLPPLVRDPAGYAAAKASPAGEPAARQPVARFPATPRVPTFSASFPGISSASEASISSGEPPDTQIAVGQSWVFEMVNQSGQIYSKTGTPIGSPFPLSSFFSVPSNLFPSDPRILYDAHSGRWYASILALYPPQNTGEVILAVSTTSDPTGTWVKYVVYQSNSGICDQPKLGYSNIEIVIACSVFSVNATTETFVGGVIIVASKGQADSGSVLSFGYTQPNSSFFGVAAAQILANGYNDAYLVQNLGNRLGLITSSGDPATPGFSGHFTATTVPMAQTSPAPQARQQGTTIPIDTGDDRFTGAIVGQNGKLWTVATVACTPVGDTVVRSCIRLVELQLGPIVMLQDFTTGKAFEDVYYPALSLDSIDNAALDISRSSSSEYASHGLFLELSGTTDLVDAGIANAGTAPYSGRRWGDYGGAAFDPQSPNSLWIAGEYSAMPPAGFSGPSWATGIEQFQFTTVQLSQSGAGFGMLPLGTTSAPQGVTITNTGSVNADVTASLNSGSTDQFRTVDNTCLSANLAPMATCTAHFTFNPTSAGDKQARFNVTGSDFSPVTLVLTGTGVGDACASAAISTDVTSPQDVGALVTMSATSAGCPDASPLYRFWLRDTNAVWHIVKDFSTVTSFVWDTSIYAPGTYLTGLWVKDASSTNAYDAYAFGTFTLGLPICSSSNMTSDLVSPQAAGAMVTFTASSIGCPNPLYQWWVRDAAGTWSIAVPFAAGNTFAWNTSTLTEGTYQIGVWAKQKLSSNSYDAFAFVTYTLTVTHCGTVGLSSNVPSPQAAGGTVNLTATATACPGATYRFYVRDGAGNWHIVQDFGTTATYAWGPASPVSTTNAGTYLLGVWARQPGSANTFDAFFFVTFSLTTGTTTCTVNIATSQVAPQPAGTTISWTATPTNCPGTPLNYQFWVNPPGGTWAVAQPFGTSNTFAWTGSAAGTYQIGVWVKQAGSTGTYDNFAFTTFTLSSTAAAQTCTSVAVSSSPASPQTVGTTVTLTAAASGCPTPTYQFWVRDPAANWSVAQPYGNSATLSWNTTGQQPGTYLIGVWVLGTRPTSTTPGYDAYSFITYTITLAPAQVCSSVGISPSMTSPQAAGSSITFTATAAGCNTPDFQFFVAPPNGSFGVTQAFSSANTFAWRTNGLPPGPYQIGVWARQHGSTAGYEAFAFITFQLQPAFTQCGTLTLTATLGQVLHGNSTAGPFTVTGSASGCSTPMYQFYVRIPGGSYVMVQPFSGTATYSYPPPPAPTGTPVYTPGGYSVLVLARDAGSMAAFETFAVTDFLFDP